MFSAGCENTLFTLISGDHKKRPCGQLFLFITVMLTAKVVLSQPKSIEPASLLPALPAK